MPTLYIRDVPAEVAETLKARAAAAGQSLSAYILAQLEVMAARPNNADVAQRLRERDREAGVSTDDILAALVAGRG